MVTHDQVIRGATNYYDREIAQKSKGAVRFAAYFLLPSVPGMVEGYVQAFCSSPAAGEIMDGDRINLEEARDRALQAMEKCGSVEMYGFRFNAQDIEHLYEYIIRA